jgi:putative hydrolase of the HAD superfamily
VRHRFEAVWFDAGGVLVLPDPTVIGPLLAYYGASLDVEDHRRAHYAAMAVKSAQGAEELDWIEYDKTYVRTVGVDGTDVDEAARLLGMSRHAPWWRWPIPDSLDALAELARREMPMAVVSNAAGQIEEVLRRTAVCQVGDGAGVAMRCVIDSTVVGVAKPDPAIFEHAAIHFPGVRRDAIAYVGDSVTMDVAGATAAGLHPILLDPFDDHAGADFDRIRSLAELL